MNLFGQEMPEYAAEPLWTTRAETPVDELLRKTKERLAEAMELLTEARRRWIGSDPYPDEVIWEYRVKKLEEEG